MNWPQCLAVQVDQDSVDKTNHGELHLVRGHAQVASSRSRLVKLPKWRKYKLSVEWAEGSVNILTKLALRKPALAGLEGLPAHTLGKARYASCCSTNHVGCENRSGFECAVHFERRC